MDIVHVVRQFHPAVGGFESVVLELASRQVAAGHRVRVVTLDRLFNAPDKAALPARENLQGIEIVRIPFFGSTRYPLAFSVLRHIRGARLVHVHAIDFFFDYLAWTKPIHRRTLVVSTHGGFFHTGYAAPAKRLYFALVTRLALNAYAGVAAVSAGDYELFAKIRKSGLVCIENGVNIAKYAGLSPPQPAKAILSVGRLSTNKRLDRLIAFAAALRRRDPEWTLKILGRLWDVPVSALRACAVGAGIADAVELLESPTDEAIRLRMGQCSVVASASEYEGFGLAVIEGISAGMYPLLSDIPAFRRLVAQTGIGAILDYDQPEDAAARFLETWRGITRDYAASRRAAMAAVAQYDWRGVARSYAALYDAVLGRGIRTLLDVPVRACTSAEAAKLLDTCFGGESPKIVVFANAHTLNVARTDARFRSILQKSVVFNDGVGVDVASRLLYGKPFPENLNGTDFVPRYLRQTRHRYRVFLLGAKPGIAERAAGRLDQLSPAHEIVGCHAGYFPAGRSGEIVAAIRDAKADIVLVGMGNPRQEIWLEENLAACGCRLGFAVGALFDFLSGEIPRAPRVVQSLHLEWLFRLVREPKRLARRYLLGNPVFLLRVAGQFLSGSRVTAAALAFASENFADAANGPVYSDVSGDPRNPGAP
jgi:alpha-1,3-mannosyltransferase